MVVTNFEGRPPAGERTGLRCQARIRGNQNFAVPLGSLVDVRLNDQEKIPGRMGEVPRGVKTRDGHQCKTRRQYDVATFLPRPGNLWASGERQRAGCARNRRNFLQVDSKERCCSSESP